MKEDKRDTTKTKPTIPTRLPCRGCLKTCSQYESCKGSPWRSTQAKKLGKI